MKIGRQSVRSLYEQVLYEFRAEGRDLNTSAIVNAMLYRGWPAWKADGEFLRSTLRETLVHWVEAWLKHGTGNGVRGEADLDDDVELTEQLILDFPEDERAIIQDIGHRRVWIPSGADGAGAYIDVAPATPEQLREAAAKLRGHGGEVMRRARLLLELAALREARYAPA